MTTRPSDPQLTDRYTCSVAEISARRRAVGASLRRDRSGQLRWIGAALAGSTATTKR
jgi:hypothetical protein